MVSEDWLTKAKGAHKGQATCSSMLWPFSFGNCGIQMIAKKGELSTINCVDYEFMNTLQFIYFTTVAIFED